MKMKIRILKNDNGFFEVEANGKIVGSGYMMLPADDDDFSYLEQIEIEEEFRNRGIGTAALYKIYEVFGSFFLAPDSEDAERLYDRICDRMKGKDYGAFGFAIDQGFGVFEM